MELQDVLQMEYGMSQGFMAQDEFFEGIRANVVQKDRNPRWQHNHVD